LFYSFIKFFILDNKSINRMTTHCYSCGAATEGEVKKEAYCKYCLDENGQLKERKEIKKGIAGWLNSWTNEELNETELLQRAENYMKGMPKWAE